MIIRGLVEVKKLRFFNSKYLRFLSKNATGSLVRNTELDERRYIRRLRTQELKPPPRNFLRSLFKGEVEKSIFQYPALLREEDLELIIDHSSKVEDFFTNNTKTLLSEDTLQKLRELELFGFSIPQKYGGSGYSETESTFLVECTGINPALGRFIAYNESFCKLINLYGTEEQKEKYLPRLAGGKSFLTLVYLENCPLINLIKFKGCATADEEKNCYILNAEKKWVHNADKADLFLVMVKLPTIIDNNSIALKLSMFIVDKNTPGVTVNRLLSQKVEEYNMFEVSIKNACISQDNILGNLETDGFKVLKSSLFHTNTYDAALCLSLMKQILHDTVVFIHEKNLNDASEKFYNIIADNVGIITGYIYGLESLLYFLTGRFDSYANSDFFDEAVLAKVMALECLQVAIKKYTEILGRESVKESRILEEAIKAVQFYSVFDENIDYIKIMIGAEGIVAAASKLSNKVKMLKKSYDYFKETLLNFFTTEELQHKQYKSKYNFKMELHESLSSTADCLENNCAALNVALLSFFTQYGSLALENEHVIIKLTEIAAYVYASIACLSRASYSICYDFKNFEDEVTLARGFVHFACLKIEQLILEETKYSGISENYRILGKLTFNNKYYPAEHPLSRTF